MQDKALSMLGLAEKARKVVSGEFSVEKAVKTGMACLVVVSTDASDNTKKNFSDMCEFYECDLCFYGTKEELGNAIGKQFRASVAITDENLAAAVKKQMYFGMTTE